MSDFLRRRFRRTCLLLAGLALTVSAAGAAQARTPPCFEEWWQQRLAAAGREDEPAFALLGVRLVNDVARTAADLDPLLRQFDALRGALAGRDPLVASEIDALLLQGDVSRGDLELAAVRAARLGLVRHYRLLGPFAVGSEPASGDGGDASQAPWRSFDTGPESLLPLVLLMDPAEKATAYAAFYLRADRAVAVAIRFGADDHAALFIDGAPVLDPEGRHDLAFDQHAAFVRLDPGWHRISFRVEQDTGGWGLVSRVTAPDGGPLPAGVSISRPEDLAAVEREIAERGAHPPARAEGRTLPERFAALARRGDPVALAHQALDLAQRNLPDRQSDLASTVARRAADARPRDLEIQLVAHDVERDPSRRREALERALALDSTHPAALRQLAQYYLAFGQDDESRRTAERALAACPARDPYLLGWIAVSKNSRGFPGGALAELEQLTREFPHQQVLLSRLGALARREDLPVTARRAWQQLLELSPSDQEVRSQLLQLELEAGGASAALALVDDALALEPAAVPWYAQRARLLLADLQPQEALDAARQGLRLAPDDPELLILEGEASLALGDGPAAAEAWQKASLTLEQDLGLAERIAAVTGVDESFGTDWAVSLEQAQQTESERPLEGDPAVVSLARVAAFRVRDDGQAIRFHQEILRVRHPEQALSARQTTVTYSPMLQRATILESRLIRRDGSVLVASRAEQPLLPDPELRMWYDTRVITLTFPRLEEGDLIEIRYRIADRGTVNQIGAGYFGEVEYLGETIPVLASRLVIDAPVSRPVRYELVHVPSPPATSTEAREDRAITVIDFPSLPAYRQLPSAPPFIERVPYATLGTIEDWNALGRTYAALIAKQTVIDADIRAAVQEVISGARTPREKVEAIYAWVIENTRYVALEFGIHALKPYEVTSVFRRRFGDCKDKAALMVAMLREAGIGANVVVLRTSDLGLPDTTIPSLSYFNHAIVYIPSEDLFLDGTVLHHGPTETPRLDLGALGLIIDAGAEGGGRLVVTPAATPTSAETRYAAEVQLAPDGEATVKGRVVAFGESAAEERTHFRLNDERGATLSSRLRRVYSDISLTGSSFGSLELDAIPVSYEFRARVPRFARLEGSTLRAPTSFFPLGLPVEAVSPGREIPLQLPQPFLMSSELTLEIPEGWSLSGTPRTGELASRWGTVTLGVDTDRRVVRVETRIEFLGGQVPVDELAEFSNFAEQVRQLLSQPLVLGTDR